ncbi:phosphotransferase [Nocardia sp. NPDC003482]
MAIDSGLPGREALAAACAAFGLSGRVAKAVLLHQRSNAVWLLPEHDVVVRLAPDTETRRERARAAVEVTRWLSNTHPPVALAPLPGPQPINVANAVATFWPYRPTPDEATASELGHLLRRLHDAGEPPAAVRLPRYRPLRRLSEALEIDRGRAVPALDPTDHEWLRQQATRLIDRFDRTEFPLGIGLIHGDPHTENALRDNGQWVLIDWDNTALGPRELDLVSQLPDHFHESHSTRAKFADAYGYDLLAWPVWTMLRDITELHSLGSYLRLAPDKPAAAIELRRRVNSLRNDDRSVVWRAIGCPTASHIRKPSASGRFE